MFREIKDPNIWLVNATIAVVGVAYGMAISILAVFLDKRGSVADPKTTLSDS